MTYSAPLAAISSALKHGTGLVAAIEQGLFGELGMEDIDAIVAEAGRFAGEVIAPLNRIGDIYGTSFKDGIVATAPGWKEAYRAWRLAGWNAVTAPAEWGGQALPQIVNAACTEMWQAASMGFANGPMLTMAAIDALSAHGSDALKRTYLEKLVSGEWMGTMQLTEPQAGSDVGALRTRAERAVDGSYRIKGQKYSSPMASTISPRTSSTSCSPGCRMGRQAHAEFPCSWCRNFCSRPMARSVRVTTYARIRSNTNLAFMDPRPAR